jgi:hypothetical protein
VKQLPAAAHPQRRCHSNKGQCLHAQGAAVYRGCVVHEFGPVLTPTAPPDIVCIGCCAGVAILCWPRCIDPLDGTCNFAHSYPGFCVSIGVLRHAVPMAGCVIEFTGGGGGGGGGHAGGGGGGATRGVRGWMGGVIM